ncbi:hypothetical protein SAMN02910355_2248 [Terrisporobacter glycolicus]|nr:hypothetical protein SAMN02910355_2248 [Terrisporobacter glycolicus]
MAGVDFSLKEEDLGRIQEAIMDFEGDSERVINDCLANEVRDKLITSITNLIPVSEKNKKQHAKTSNPLDGKIRNNLTLWIHTKSKFNYLYFPQNAEGTSKGNSQNDFMEKGIDAEYDNAVNIILEKLQRRMEEI